MASTSTKALTPTMTLKGHGEFIQSMSYFPDGQRMISGCWDKTVRQWDLKAGKEIEEARVVFKEEVMAIAVSSDSRWVVTGGGDNETGELKACIDISMDSKLLASGAEDWTARIWNLETGKMVAGPFKSIDYVGAVRISTNSKKLAIKSDPGTCLEVWDVQSQKLDVSVGKPSELLGFRYVPIFWTNKNKNILAAFRFTNEDASTIYEFDASTLETVGTPFEGHTEPVIGLALSFDSALLASSSFDQSIKLWAFESRQLLASFDLDFPSSLVLSPDSHQLAYTTYTYPQVDCNIYICNTPPDVLAQATGVRARTKSTLNDLLNSDATGRPPAVRRRPPIPVIPMTQRIPPTTDPILHRLRQLLPFSSRMNAISPVRNRIEPRGPLDFPATSPLPSNRLHAENHPSTPTPFKLLGGRAFFNPILSSSDKGKKKARERKREPAKVVDVPLGQATYGDAVGVDDGIRPYVLFFCLSWFQKKEREEVRRPVYDDDPEDDEDEEDILNRVALPPPNVQLEAIELKSMAGQR